MRCHFCGADGPEGEWFCPACGEEVLTDEELARIADGSAQGQGAPLTGETQLVDAELAETQLAEAEPTELVAPEGATEVARAGETVAVPSPHADTAGDPPTMVAPVAAAAPAAPAVESPAQRPYVPESEPRRSGGVPRGLVIGIVLALLLAAAGAFAAYAWSTEMWGGKTLPDVVGRHADEAASMLAEAGFASEFEEQYADEGIGVVLRMDPEAGKRIPEGTRVSLVIGKQRTLPELVGVPLDQAQQELARMGLENVTVEYRSSSADESTILEVSPEAGTPVSSGDAVVLYVSQPCVVPDVLGRTEKEAVEAVEAAGLRANVTYVDSDLREGTVVAVTPDPGTKIGEGVTVELSVAKAKLDDLFDIAAIFAAPPAEIVSFLKEEGFKLDVGYLAGDGSVRESLSRDDRVAYTFTPEPYSHHIGQWDMREPVDVMSSGSEIAGVRLEFPLKSVGITRTDASEATLTQVMGLCGLEGLARTYTQDTIVFPGQDSYQFWDTHTKFICGGGDAGDNVWTVLVNESLFDGTYAIVTYAPRSLYDDVKLEDYDGSITDFVAYVDMYTE